MEIKQRGNGTHIRKDLKLQINVTWLQYVKHALLQLGLPRNWKQARLKIKIASQNTHSMLHNATQGLTKGFLRTGKGQFLFFFFCFISFSFFFSKH